MDGKEDGGMEKWMDESANCHTQMASGSKFNEAGADVEKRNQIPLSGIKISESVLTTLSWLAELSLEHDGVIW